MQEQWLRGEIRDFADFKRRAYLGHGRSRSWGDEPDVQERERDNGNCVDEMEAREHGKGFEKKGSMPNEGDEPDFEEMEARERAKGKGKHRVGSPNGTRIERVEHACRARATCSNQEKEERERLAFEALEHHRVRHEQVEREREQASARKAPDVTWTWPAYGKVDLWFHNGRYVPYNPYITDGRLRYSQMWAFRKGLCVDGRLRLPYSDCLADIEARSRVIQARRNKMGNGNDAKGMGNHDMGNGNGAKCMGNRDMGNGNDVKDMGNRNDAKDSPCYLPNVVGTKRYPHPLIGPHHRLREVPLYGWLSDSD